MINRIPIILVLFSSVILLGAWAPASGIIKQNIYWALQSDEIGVIDKELLWLSKNPLKDADAYTGALHMKKAGLQKDLKQKLNTFKAGRNLLENAIKQEPQNAEYAFLRLVIQEHAPAVLGYNTNIKKDALLVKQQFKSFEPALQRIVKDYSIKRSKILKASELE